MMEEILWPALLVVSSVVRIVHSTPSVTFNVTYLDEHSANISIWSNTNHFFELNASDTECEDGADGSGGPSSSCNIQVHARVPSGGVAATVDGIPSGVGRQISISSVNYDDEAGDSGVISDTFAITICTTVLPPANLTIYNISTTEFGIIITNTTEVNAVTSGYYYEVHIWQLSKWVPAKPTFKKTLTEDKDGFANEDTVTVDRRGALYRVTLTSVGSCIPPGSSTSLVAYHQTGLDTPTQPLTHLVTKDGNTICFLWIDNLTKNYYNKVNFQMVQNGVNKDKLTVDVSRSKGVLCMTSSDADTSQSVEIEFSIENSITVEGHNYTQVSPPLGAALFNFSG
ncbi:uncharacterized protein LOC142334815 [Convolutriloba macropyga]|uniref:uncharacterized protein LOC142334815 n=1 Tax=Convolutriloba macropyga TaxID=536237 RepID=UPI003F51EF06